MTSLTKSLFSPQLIGITESVLYQVPTNTTTVIKYISLHNTSTTPASVTISTPVAGDISSTSNQLAVKAIAGRATLKVFDAVDYPINAGSSIRAFSDTEGVVNIRAGGIEIVRLHEKLL